MLEVVNVSLWICENDHVFPFWRKPDECPLCGNTGIESHMERKLKEIEDIIER